MTPEARAYSQTLGEEHSIWFKISPFLSADDPMGVLMKLLRRRGGCVPITMREEKIYLLSEIAHIRHVLVDHVDNYAKYFDGLKPIFGKAMITVDGVLWQKVRKPQQPYFHPHVYADYLPYLLIAVRARMDQWAKLAAAGETVEALEQTWSLAADMICRALFDREVPFNPTAVFSAVKAYTDVANHRSVRLKKVAGGLQEVSADEAPAQAIGAWLTLPEAVIGAPPWQARENTLLKMMQSAEADPDMPAWDHQQVMDEIKQYLWAGTETTALTLGWALYLLSQHPEVAEGIRREGEQVYGDRDPTPEDIERLSYTRSVMLETLRLYPPAWALIRTAVADDEIAGHKVKAGDRIVLSPYAVHHDARYWDEPEAFRPERFAPGSMQKRAKYSYLPFGAGKRFCLGGQLAQVEVVLALTLLLRRFRPRYIGQVPAPIAASVTLMPRFGLPFKLEQLS
ncbi:MAG: cytochrome P450 [Hyphomicrobiaceae bacterium]|nr:MAG: cytochrome P450 [Hyphomicrobiaceae bacterium]